MYSVGLEGLLYEVWRGFLGVYMYIIIVGFFVNDLCLLIVLICYIKILVLIVENIIDWVFIVFFIVGIRMIKLVCSNLV